MGIITGGKTLKAPLLTDMLNICFSYLSISRPCQGSTLWGFGLAVCADHFLSQLVHNYLALQILHEKKNQEVV